MNLNIAILEIRAGTGGSEAEIWGRDLLRMYLRYAASQNWKVEAVDSSVIKIKGVGSFEKLKYEAGVIF